MPTTSRIKSKINNVLVNLWNFCNGERGGKGGEQFTIDG